MSPAGRAATDTGRLARLGFADPSRAGALLEDPALDGLGREPAVLEGLAATADPDTALLGLVRVLEGLDGPGPLRAALRDDQPLRDRLLAVLGASTALGDHLARRGGDWRLLSGPLDLPARPSAVRAALLTAVGADPAAAEPVATAADAADALRVAYRREVLRLAAGDLTGALDLVEVAASLADLAGATLDAALAVARADLPEDAVPCRLGVVGMGKCGGHELNYVSDVDVVFVAEPAGGADEQAALRTATRLATGLIRVCGATTAEGTIWPVDAALRPEGKNGPLVRTLASHRAYYERWARTWEFQALLKARPVAGDLALAGEWVEAVSPLVWEAQDRPDFVSEVQAMRRRVEGTLPVAQAERELKLGPGGLRDVEFAVQLLQMVHGRSDDRLRSGNTLSALEELSTWGYVARDDAARLDRAYRFLRTLEHRLQLQRLRRTHLMPQDDAELRRLGRSVGLRSDPVTTLRAEWRRQAREVRRLHEKLFYSPLLQATSRLAPDEARLTPEAARARLQALGYEDPAGALRHIEALTAGVSRRAAIQRTLLPVLLGWFGDSHDADAGLLAFRQVSDALGTTPWYLRLLRDEGETAERMARVLSAGRYPVDLLLRAPEAVRILADDAALVPRPAAALVDEVVASVRRHDDPTVAAGAARAVRRRELLRTATADLLDRLDVDGVGHALSDIAAATVAGGLEAAVRAIEAERRDPLPTRVAVIAMGRLGGRELGYGSDADVLFVHEPLDGADEREAGRAALAVVQELRRLLALPAPDPPLVVDPDLRPEGRNGPLVRSLGSYAAYYARWSLVWEAQALLRAAPVAGDPDLGRRFVELVEPVRWPASGLSDHDAREVRRIKARVEAERLPRGADPGLNLKLGRGGLADVEWTVQLLQLQHAHAVPGLRTTSTVEALHAAVGADLVAREDAEVLLEAWRLASALRNGVMLVRGRAGDQLPTDLRELAGVAAAAGHPASPTGALVDEWRRTTRRARAVVERVFYG
ncbi:bifunctional [glutamine synthetase] adenylyltransferase/[glutamine synthetase]-adenylyl-L-tyrosine phosphorylase [Vallicoccus soli]|uniref:Bifunctional glutamine synthetase adenylyltransferase/adenylyl-removing enzyme n=1 Tax=Vallicoccus soli TaxID=2339232 RepID=A0A3A3Z7Z2_9ACTN|nr:bifunctional [glutamine synthetase] adenylyltransferase/[glutamine synthetase]-adenylyl-L-tyrosine phosphorylase [Vallicoccus soli]RJK96957.1 bifunctional [glutamine synthetase] adenylyltransferase/[glutamine synthetase]-adenylyl-L-tyrosine phosphorylase [Vallicoccus soli]